MITKSSSKRVRQRVLEVRNVVLKLLERSWIGEETVKVVVDQSEADDPVRTEINAGNDPQKDLVWHVEEATGTSRQ